MRLAIIDVGIRIGGIGLIADSSRFLLYFFVGEDFFGVHFLVFSFRFVSLPFLILVGFLNLFFSFVDIIAALLC